MNENHPVRFEILWQAFQASDRKMSEKQANEEKVIQLQKQLQLRSFWAIS
jgi:hypothetical protein